MSTARPSAKQHNSDSKRLDKAKAAEDDAWDSEASEEVEEQQVGTQEKSQRSAQIVKPSALSESDETTDDEDDDEEEHLVIKTKGSKAPLNKRPSVDASAVPSAVERVTSRSEQPSGRSAAANNLQPTRQADNRSRSRSRTRAPSNATSSGTGKVRRKSSARRQSHVDHDHAKTGVFARTKSQVGFEVHGENDQQDESDSSVGRDFSRTERAPAKESHHDTQQNRDYQSPSLQENPQSARTVSNIKSPVEIVTSPRSVLNLEDDESKPGFPFPASDGEGSASRQRSLRASPQPARRDQGSPIIKESNNTSLRPGVQAVSPNGSDANTLVGSTTSPGRASTPRLTTSTALPGIAQSPQTPNRNGPNTPPPNPHARKHVRTRNSHTSLRSLASMRLAGPPPHPLTSPGGAKGRVTSLSGRSGAAMAAPQLNREVARGLCSTSPTETTASQSESVGRNGTASAGMPSVARTGSQRSLRDYFGLVSSAKSGERNGDRQPDMARKGSFHSTNVTGLPRVNSSSALSNAGAIANQGASSRLSAHSVAQAAARLPSTSTLSASAYGDQLPESSQVGLISRFLTPSSWNSRVLVAPTSKDRHGKSRANTAPGFVEKPSVFPQSPFAAAHASLVRTLMEDGSKPVATLGHHGVTRGADRMRSETGPVPRSSTAFSSLALTPAHHDDASRSRVGSRDSRQNKEKEMVLGLTPFEMSVSRCLEQRKNAVQLSTGGPLGPLPP